MVDVAHSRCVDLPGGAWRTFFDDRLETRQSTLPRFALCPAMIRLWAMGDTDTAEFLDIVSFGRWQGSAP